MQSIFSSRLNGAASEENHASLWCRALPAVGLILLCFAAYWPLRLAGYIWDDNVWLTGNPIVQNWNGLWYIWFEPHTSTQYYPLIYTAFLLEFKLWGLNPLGYHLVNIGLQAINSIVLWRILRKLGLKAAWVAAAVFAIHPVQVETVGWVTEQKNLLSGLFYFSAILFWLHWSGIGGAEPTDLLKPAKRNRTLYFGATFCFLLALLAKTDTCTLPVVILLLIWWKNGKITRQELPALAPWFCLALVFAATTMHMEHQLADVRGPAFTFTLAQRLIIAGMNLWFYPFKIIWPHPLLEIYPRWNIDQISLWQWIFPISAAAVPVILWLLRKKIGRGPLTAVAYYGITIWPVLGFTPFYTMVYTFVADHYQYLACIGIIALVTESAACGFELINKYSTRKNLPTRTQTGSNRSYWPSRLPAGTASIMLLATLEILTYKQSDLYNPPEKLWQNVLNNDKTSWQAGLQLAALDAFNHNTLEAYNKMIDAIRQPGGQNYLALNFLGLFYLNTEHDYQSAAELLSQSLVLNPYQSVVICEMAQCREKLGQVDQAIKDIKSGLVLMPNDYFLLRTNGEFLAKAGQYNAALEQFQKALDSQPFDAASLYDMAITLEKLGHWQEALADYAQTVEIDPDWGAAQYMYGKLLLAHGQTGAAAEHLKRAVDLAPDQIDAHLALAEALEGSGDVRGAAAQRAIAGQIEKQPANERSTTQPAQ